VSYPHLNYEAVVIGVSAGGLFALSTTLGEFPADFPLPVIVVQHRSKDESSVLENVLQSKCKMKIKQADEKEKIRGAVVYIAPAGYHLLIEKNRSLIGVILTGANKDGAAGIQTIKARGGLTIAQSPASASFPTMPQAAIDTGSVKYIFELEEVKNFLLDIGKN